MTVKSWGTGRPDYSKPTIPSRPTLVDESNTQIKWTENKTYTITSMATAIDSFYTVIPGYNLTLGSIDISVDNSCIDQLRILGNSDVLADFKFDIRGSLIFTALTGQTLSAGETITAYIWNNDAIESNFTLTMSGVLDLVRTAIT